MKQTGFTPGVRSLVRQRSDGHCEKCGLRRGTEYHHRRPRGMGGTNRTETNQPSACLFLCQDCHRHIESERGDAINNGWLVTQHHLPADIPVVYRGAWVFLDDLGGLKRVQEELL